MSSGLSREANNHWLCLQVVPKSTPVQGQVSARKAPLLTAKNLYQAFDDPWKGSDDAWEPEKHWGIYAETRKPKRFISRLSSQFAYSE